MSKNQIKYHNYFFEDSFTACAYSTNDDSLYCITHSGFFMKIDCNDFKKQFFTPGWIGEKNTLFNSVNSAAVADKIYFFNTDGTGYLVYDTSENMAEYKNISDVEPTPSTKKSNIINALVSDSYIFIFLRNTSKIIKIDGNKGEIIDTIQADYLFNPAIVVKNHEEALIIFEGDSLAKKFDLKNGRISDIILGYEFDNIWDACIEGDTMYVMSNDGRITSVNSNGMIAQYDLKGNSNDYSIVLKNGNKIWIFPALGDDIYFIENEQIHLYEDYDDIEYGAVEGWFNIGAKYVNYVRAKDGFVLPARVGNKIAYIDYNGELTWKKMVLKEPTNKLGVIVSTQGYALENGNDCSLENLIEMV